MQIKSITGKIMFKNSNCDRKFSGINVKFVSYIVKSAHVKYKGYQTTQICSYSHKWGNIMIKKR